MYIAIIIVALAAAVRGQQGGFYGGNSGFGGYGGGPGGGGGQFGGGGAAGIQGGPQGSASWLQGPQGRSLNGQFNAPSQGQQPLAPAGTQAGLPVIFTGSPSAAVANPAAGTAQSDAALSSGVANGAGSPVANAPAVVVPAAGSSLTVPLSSSGLAYAPNGQAGYGNLWDSSPYGAGQAGQFSQGQNGFGRSYGGSPFDGQGGYGGGSYAGQGGYGGQGGFGGQGEFGGRGGAGGGGRGF